jgi:4-amino-4-deoxy-L-arabinose transferase-like glycosyltransferase
MAEVLRTTPMTTSDPGAFARWWNKARTSCFWVVLIAFVLRFGWIVVAHTYKFKTFEDNFSFGWEMGRIGRSLAQGQGFSNPFSATTGPTAWEPPVYPFLIAAVFKVFGIYTRVSALVLLTINSLCSALTCIPIFLIAKRCFNERLAIWTSWLWALMPPVMYWCTRWVWETSLAGLLLADTRPGRERWTGSLDPVRADLGRRSAHQHFSAGVSAGFGAVGVVPAIEAR